MFSEGMMPAWTSESTVVKSSWIVAAGSSVTDEGIAGKGPSSPVCGAESGQVALAVHSTWVRNLVGCRVTRVKTQASSAFIIEFRNLSTAHKQNSLITLLVGTSGFWGIRSAL
jgi:hypothetical protein